MRARVNQLYEFDNFCVDSAERALWRDGKPVQLTPKAFDTLLALISRSGHLVEKDELLREVWPDTFVEEATLAQNISTLRKVLGHAPTGQPYIETIKKRGYRFASPVRAVQVESPALIIHEQTSTELIIEQTESEETDNRPCAACAASQKAQEAQARQAALAQHALAPARSTKLKLLCVVALVVACAGGSYLWTFKSKPQPGAAQINSIAVLPFRSLGAESNDELLGLGMADATISKLSNFPQLSVLPTSAVVKYTADKSDALAMGRALGVDAVLTGTAQRAGERVRVTVQLIRLGDGKILWSDKFDERYTSIFDIQDSISERVAQALTLHISDDRKKLLAKRFTANTEAYQSYLMGVYFWSKRSKEGLSKALDYFQQATAKDPDYALAYAGLADTYFLNLHYNYQLVPREEAIERGQAAAAKALQLDDTLPEAYLAMAMFAPFSPERRSQASGYLRRAIELNPSYGLAHQRYAWRLADDVDLTEAVREMRRAQELDPLSPTNNAAFGTMLLYARQFDEALKYCQRAVELDPAASIPRINLGAAYEQKAMYREALTEYQKARELGGPETFTRAAEAHALAVSGQKPAAQKIVAELEQRARTEDVPCYPIALIYVALDRRDEAFNWLNKALDRRMLALRDLRHDPMLDALRSDPRFNALMSRYKMPD